MVFRKTVTTPVNQMFKLETVSCEDCRFMREENKEGRYVCLAQARRRVHTKGKKECQRFQRNTPSQQTDFVEPKDPVRENTDFFDTRPLYELISGKAE